MIKVPRWFGRSWWSGALLVGCGVLLFVVWSGSGKPGGPSYQEVVTRGGTDYPGWSVAVLVVAVLLAALGLLSFVEWAERRQVHDPAKRTIRFERLASSLNQALSDISRIRTEVDEGNQLLARLQQEAEVNTRLARLSSEDAQAVLMELREAVRGETSRGTWFGLAINFVFFGAGVALTLLLRH